MNYQFKLQNWGREENYPWRPKIHFKIVRIAHYKYKVFLFRKIMVLDDLVFFIPK